MAEIYTSADVIAYYILPTTMWVKSTKRFMLRTTWISPSCKYNGAASQYEFIPSNHNIEFTRPSMSDVYSDRCNMNCIWRQPRFFMIQSMQFVRVPQ